VLRGTPTGDKSRDLTARTAALLRRRCTYCGGRPRGIRHSRRRGERINLWAAAALYQPLGRVTDPHTARISRRAHDDLLVRPYNAAPIKDAFVGDVRIGGPDDVHLGWACFKLALSLGHGMNHSMAAGQVAPGVASPGRPLHHFRFSAITFAALPVTISSMRSPQRWSASAISSRKL